MNLMVDFGAQRRYEAFRFGGHPTWKEGDAQEWRRLCLELERQRS